MRKSPVLLKLAFVASFLLPFAFGFSSYQAVVEADFLTVGLKYEAVDAESLCCEKQNLVVIVVSAVSLLFWKDPFFDPISTSYLSSPEVCPQSLILRC